jgi:hypothetical protein
VDAGFAEPERGTGFSSLLTRTKDREWFFTLRRTFARIVTDQVIRSKEDSMAAEQEGRREIGAVEWQEMVRRAEEAGNDPHVQPLSAEARALREVAFTRVWEEKEAVFRAARELEAVVRSTALTCGSGHPAAHRLARLPLPEMLRELGRMVIAGA